MKKSFLLCFITLPLLFVSCASVNKYMTLDTTEYQDVTKHILGKWNMTSFVKDDKEIIGNTFDGGTLDFDFTSKKATFTLHVSKEILAEKLVDWEQAYPGITVDSYDITITSVWHVDKNGETIFFDNSENNIIITGSGENFEGFYGFERSKFEASKSARSSNSDLGAAGLFLGAAVTAATGTNDFFIEPAFGFGYWIIDLSPSGFTLDNRQGDLIKVTK